QADRAAAAVAVDGHLLDTAGAHAAVPAAVAVDRGAADREAAAGLIDVDRVVRGRVLDVKVTVTERCVEMTGGDFTLLEEFERGPKLILSHLHVGLPRPEVVGMSGR